MKNLQAFVSFLVFVSVCLACNVAFAKKPAPHKTHAAVTVRPLVQGSGAVVCFEDSRDMRPAVRVGVTVRSGQ